MPSSTHRRDEAGGPSSRSTAPFISLALLLTAAFAGTRAAPLSAQAPSPDRPIRPWLVLGTIPADTGADRVTRAYVPDEGALAPSAGDSAAGHVWRAVQADSLGRIDFNQVFTEPPHDRAVAYGLTYLNSPSDRTIRLAVETDDDGRLWLNGQLVYSREVARGVDQTDTVTLRLARGWNRLLYEVINRSGGFGMGSRLLASSPGDIAQLTPSDARPAQLATGPAPFLTLGAATVAAEPVLDAKAGALEIALRVPAVRWGALTAPVTLEVAGAEAPVPEQGAGPPPDIALDVAWTALGRTLARGDALLRARSGTRTLASGNTGLDAGGLLELLSRPIVVRGWQRRDSADARTATGRGWTPLPPHDSTAPGDTTAGAIGVVVRVPPALDGLTLELDAAEYGPDARLFVNDAAHRRDAMGRITLCAPCRSGDRLDIVVQPGDSVWWDPPRIIMRDAGWWAVAEGTHWARVFTGDSTFALAPTAADSVLKASLVPGRRHYHALIAAHLARLAPAVRAIAGDTLWAVGNSHIDAAWLWRWPETQEVLDATWGSAVKLMRKYPEMEFAGSAARYYTWLEQLDPDLLARIQALVKAGRWHPVGGWWVEADGNIPGGESLVRQALYGQRAFMRMFGEISHVAWIPDTFGYTWQLPQIFHLSGMDFFVTQKLRWNDTDRWTADRNVFWWEGRDGTRVLTYIPYGYSHDLNGRRLAREWIATKDSSAAPVLYTLYGVGDHGGGPTAAMLDRRRALNRIPTFPPVVDRSPDSTLSLMRAEMPADGPIIDDELYLEYHRGVLTTQSETKRWNRRMQNLLTSAEVAATAAASGPAVSVGFGRPGGPADYPYAALHEAWTLTLFNQFHDILPGSGIGPVYKDAAAMYRRADTLATSVLQGAAIALAARMDTRAPVPGAQPFLVLNPSARPRAGVVRIALQDSTAQALDDHGRRLPSALVGDTLLVHVPPVPATGTSVIFVRQGGEATTPAAVREPFAWLRRLFGREAKTAVLENRYLRVEIDPATGEIARMLDKRDGHEVLADSAHGNVLMTMPDNPKQWDAWNIDQVTGPWTPMRDSVHVGIAMRGGLATWVDVTRMDTAVNARVTQRYVLPDEAARLDIVTTIDWHASHRLLKAAFPLAVHPDSVWAEIPYGAIGRPAVPETRKDSARYETSMQRWVDASQDGFGVALVNDGKYGYDVQGDTVRLTLLRAPKYPDPDADMGTHTFTYSVVPHTGDWRSPDVLDAAEALNLPLRAVPVSPHPGEGHGAPFLRIEGGSAVLGALKRAEDDDALVVRLVEREGRASVTRIVLPWPFTATEADLLERPTGETRQATGDTLEVHLRPWQIETLLIRRRGEVNPSPD